MYEFFFSSRRWMVRLQRDRSHVGHLLVIGSILLLRRHDLLVTDQILVLFTSTKYTIFTTQIDPLGYQEDVEVRSSNISPCGYLSFQVRLATRTLVKLASEQQHGSVNANPSPLEQRQAPSVP